MDIANSNDITQTAKQYFNCFKVASLTVTILNSTQVSNLKDHYVLGEQLGWGQFGVIRACTDKSTGEVFACKSIPKDRLVTHEDICSIKLEIEIMTTLSRHPNVVGLKAVYEEENYVHLLMELCAGGELFHRLEKQGRFSEHEARVLFKDLMEVVRFCHENGVIHRDLKPENILLATTSVSSPIKLADFGLATYIKPGQNLHGKVGSPFYIAPEVLTGVYNQAADVWSAGVILYVLLSGMPPFWGKTKSRIFAAVRAANLRFPHDTWNHISSSAKDLITRMLCIDPSRRPTAAQVVAHSWVDNCSQESQEQYVPDTISCRQFEVGEGSFSIPFLGRAQDYSLNDGSIATVDGQVGQSSAFTCKSSFSEFLVKDDTPTIASGSFSFKTYFESSAEKILSSVPSLLSFTFGSLSYGADREELQSSEPNMSPLVAYRQESNTGKLLVLLPPSHSLKGEVEETVQKDMQKGGINWFKAPGVHNRRNHTIGLGEFEQLQPILTESVIRWVSCTHIPTASSLKLSLVC
ncbi:Calcium-dependent protein kinase [Quillaja saponaria]|uniref:non-specific serine/threonine protein kinase n=1 Tax=Quillaja saponaria TaxID=32244 RepID=A0AAD7L6B3_QUISA|nr:Calcium-dependent protein kinase [Quillaja saponaria]